jgi:hypothetical protein
MVPKEVPLCVRMKAFFCLGTAQYYILCAIIYGKEEHLKMM